MGVGRVAQVDVFDDSGAVPDSFFPSTVTLRWEGTADSSLYRVEQLVDGDWAVLAQIPSRAIVLSGPSFPCDAKPRSDTESMSVADAMSSYKHPSSIALFSAFLAASFLFLCVSIFVTPITLCSPAIPHSTRETVAAQHKKRAACTPVTCP